MTIDPLLIIGVLAVIALLAFLLRVKWNFKGPEKPPPRENSAPRFHASGASPRPEPDRAPAVPLTPRERDIVRLVARDLSNDEIAHELNISKRTVAKHLENIFRKLGARSRAELMQIRIDDSDE